MTAPLLDQHSIEADRVAGLNLLDVARASMADLDLWSQSSEDSLRRLALAERRDRERMLRQEAGDVFRHGSVDTMRAVLAKLGAQLVYRETYENSYGSSAPRTCTFEVHAHEAEGWIVWLDTTGRPAYFGSDTPADVGEGINSAHMSANFVYHCPSDSAWFSRVGCTGNQYIRRSDRARVIGHTWDAESGLAARVTRLRVAQAGGLIELLAVWVAGEASGVAPASEKRGGHEAYDAAEVRVRALLPAQIAANLVASDYLSLPELRELGM